MMQFVARDNHIGVPSIRNYYTFELIQTEEGFVSLKNDWNRLYNQVIPHNPFLSYEWTKAWWSHLCPTASLFLLTVHSEGQLVGVAPLRLEQKWGFRILRFIGDGRSDYLGFLVAPDHEGIEKLLLNYLYRCCDSWDLAIFRQLCDVYTNLSSIKFFDGMGYAENNGKLAPYLSSVKSWKDLCSSGPWQLRHAGQMARKFLLKGGTVKRVTGSDTHIVAEQITFIEAHSWKYRTEAAKFQTKQERGLLKQILVTLGRRDGLEVWLAYNDSQPIAYQLNFLTPERVCYYQSAYHKSYGRYYPGGVLQFHAIKRAWHEGLREFDFMLGDEQWKSTWTNGKRLLKNVALFPRTLRGRLTFLFFLLHGCIWSGMRLLRVFMGPFAIDMAAAKYALGSINMPFVT
jgi:hypothetical protein